jgi:hypothetical protein
MTVCKWPALPENDENECDVYETHVSLIINMGLYHFHDLGVCPVRVANAKA